MSLDPANRLGRVGSPMIKMKLQKRTLYVMYVFMYGIGMVLHGLA